MATGHLRDIHEAHIVFGTMNASSARLDLISASEGTRGWPFTLVLSVPQGPDWSAIAASLLGRWAASAQPLELAVDENRTVPRVRISDGDNAIRLEVIEALIEVPV